MAIQPPHILYLIDALYSTYAGAEGVLWKMTRRLPPDRYRCSVATFATRTNEVDSGRFTCPVYLFPIERTYDWRALKTAVRLAHLIRSERVSIVHTFFPASDLLGGVVAKLSGCPILVSSRRDMGFQRSAMHRFAYRLGGGLFDQVQAVSEQVRLLHIREDRLDPAKVVTVYNGVDLDEMDRYSAARLAEVGLEDGTCLIICVSNIRRVKGLDVLLRTAAIVCLEWPRAHFLIAGAVQDTEHFRMLTELACELQITGKVTFAGCCTKVPALLKASDIFYLPSRSEGLSNAMLEAMACAVPCVANDVGGNGELIQDGHNGYLVQVDDPAAAAERILTLLRNPHRARRMGQVGRQIVEGKFSVHSMISRLTELYDGLLFGSGRGAQAAGPKPIWSGPAV